MTQGRFRYLFPLTVFFFYMLLGVVYSWPLAANMFDTIPYVLDPTPNYSKIKLVQGDHLQFYYHLGLLKEAVLGRIDWFTNPYEFATEYQQARFASYFTPLSFLYLPFTIISLPFAYNTFILISFGLSGLAMYLWAKDLTGSRVSALVAGVVFDFIPIRMAEIYGGHPSGFALCLFPLTLFFFDRAILRLSLGYSAMAGLSLATLSFEYMYFSYYLLMFLMAYIPWRLAPYALKWKREGMSGGGAEIRRLLVAGVPFALGALAGIGWMFHFKKVMVEKGTFAAGRNLDLVSGFSPALSALWNPAHNGFIVYLGFPLIAAFGVAAAMFTSKARWPGRGDVLFFFSCFFVSYILAFGTTLDSYIPVYTIFYKFFPYFSFSRFPAKIMVIVITMSAALVAYAISFAARAKKGKTLIRVACAALIVLTAYDYHPKRNIGLCVMHEQSEAFRYISDNADGKYVLNIPVWPGESSWGSIYEYYAIQSKVPTINGYSPVVSKEYVNNVFWPLFVMNGGDVTAKHIKLLEKLNVGFVVFHEEAYPFKVSAFPSYYALSKLVGSGYLELVKKEEPLWVFKPVKNPRRTPKTEITSPLAFFLHAERLGKVAGKDVRDSDALTGWALTGDPDAAKRGPLNAGPYKTFPGGAYKATFRIKVADNTVDAPVARLDIVNREGTQFVVKKDIKGTDFIKPGVYQEFTLDYILQPNNIWMLEFRTHMLSDVQVFVDSIYIRLAQSVDPQWEYETEDLFHTGRIVDDPGASGGKAVLWTPGRDPVDWVIRGPGRMLNAGRYRAWFRLKSTQASPDTAIARLSASSGSTWKELAARMVKMDQLPGAEMYGETSLEFELKTKTAVEYKVETTGLSRLFVDSIRIEKVEEP